MNLWNLLNYSIKYRHVEIYYAILFKLEYWQVKVTANSFARRLRKGITEQIFIQFHWPLVGDYCIKELHISIFLGGGSICSKSFTTPIACQVPPNYELVEGIMLFRYDKSVMGHQHLKGGFFVSCFHIHQRFK